MGTIIWDGHQPFEFARPSISKPSRLLFHSVDDALRFLRSLPRSAGTAQVFRLALHQSDASVRLASLSDEEVILQLAAQLASRKVWVVSPSRAPSPRPGLMSPLSWGLVNEQKLAELMQSHSVKPGSSFSEAVAGPALAGPAEPDGGAQSVSWRQVLGAEAEAVIESVAKRTRSVAEALGELGMEVAKRLMGIQSAPGFIKRYHGMDDICLDSNGGLTGVEAKGSEGDSLTLATHTDGCAQLSHEANEKRARIMNRKKNKVGKKSARQGGPYTEEENELYRKIMSSGGEKRLVSTHTNTNSGRTQIIERDYDGTPKKGNPMKEFVISDIHDASKLFAGRKDL